MNLIELFPTKTDLIISLYNFASSTAGLVETVLEIFPEDEVEIPRDVVSNS